MGTNYWTDTSDAFVRGANSISVFGAAHRHLFKLGLIPKGSLSGSYLNKLLKVHWIGDLTPEQIRLCEMLSGPHAATIFKMLEIKANGKKLKKA